MSSMGFGQRARRWVSMMLQNTTATAAFNGWRSASFPERSGVQQGSPLSPLLYVLAAQPLASHLRHQTRQGVIRPITMPDGQPAPVSHQHADDTTIHVLRPLDAQVALDSSIALFCAATCSQLNVSKSRGFLIQAQPLASASIAALPSISFILGQQTIKHLGVLLGYDMQAASHQQIFYFLFFVWVGELFITHTWTCNGPTSRCCSSPSAGGQTSGPTLTAH